MSLTNNRRNLMKLTVGGVALSALQASQVFAQTATPTVAKTEIPRWRRNTVGDTKFTFISDGIGQYDLHPTFGKDQTAEAVSALAAANFLPTDKVKMNLNVPIVEIGTETVMFDTGIGEFGHDYGLGLLVSELERTGYSPSDITVVALSHMHIDHVGGLMLKGERVFPNARYLVGKVEYDYWTSEAAKTGPRPETVEFVTKYVTPLLDRITFIEGGQEVLSGVLAVNTFGHTPGHLSYEVKTSIGPVAITADVLLHHVFAFEEPDWSNNFDGDPAQAAETRRRLLADLADRRMPFLAYHVPLPGLGFVERDGDAYRYVPVSYQFA
jgi:glyoxylase-like metal-dependent hydrolase (beta-lactamase superfamily II)